jgi:2-polyprenyl-6-methoxyphenol hydroxylase-like FAD-dependent oxidoreductase
MQRTGCPLGGNGANLAMQDGADLGLGLLSDKDCRRTPDARCETN